jgi:hypothetical protein
MAGSFTIPECGFQLPVAVETGIEHGEFHGAQVAEPQYVQRQAFYKRPPQGCPDSEFALHLLDEWDVFTTISEYR